ncbi:Secondary metabolism regulator LAE1 [Colletotrichum shisoi]|uniref:Secondary metabolism regulator LAE1 n=1 Tax=Colletotrichum shisoi TaxID=2078593 RepID=A0A5Q4BAZ3_9PEZI|nr:Secondary metabolism regulator LAE1 [Colletotrichum shisoi]
MADRPTSQTTLAAGTNATPAGNATPGPVDTTAPASGPAPGPASSHGAVVVAEDDLTDDTASDIATCVFLKRKFVQFDPPTSPGERKNVSQVQGRKVPVSQVPSDEKEDDRLDLQHNLYLLTLDYKLGLAPPNEPGSDVKRVLDIGTGTGLWAIEFAEDHPEAEVLGVDLSPPQAEFVPPNLKFEVDDVEQPWTYSRPFDYIHIRGMTSSVSDWHGFLTQAYKGLTPGG